jgi:hypothetical protein
MNDTTPAAGDPQDDPSRRLLVRMPAERRFLPVLATACRIYSHALPGGDRLFPEVAQAVADAAAGACSGTTPHVEVEFRVTGNQLEASVAGDILRWEISEPAR